jgi:hypothetical protein
LVYGILRFAQNDKDEGLINDSQRRAQNDKYNACHAEGAPATEESQDRLREASLILDTTETDYRIFNIEICVLQSNGVSWVFSNGLQIYRRNRALALLLSRAFSRRSNRPKGLFLRKKKGTDFKN